MLRRLSVPRFRPTEAAWEYSCRAGTSGRNWAKPRPLADLAGANLEGGFVTHPVDPQLPNPWGLFAMLGNVCAWCAEACAPEDDAHVIHPYATKVPAQFHHGGRCFHPVAKALAARRNPRTPHARSLAVGLLAPRGPRGRTGPASPRPHPRPAGSGSQST